MSYEETGKSRSTAAPRKPHHLTLEDRKILTLSGVEDVASFDESEIVLRTSLGELVIEGEGLSVSRLSVESGDVHVAGYITALQYTESTGERRGLLSRLFH